MCSTILSRRFDLSPVVGHCPLCSVSGRSGDRTPSTRTCSTGGVHGTGPRWWGRARRCSRPCDRSDKRTLEQSGRANRCHCYYRSGAGKVRRCRARPEVPADPARTSSCLARVWSPRWGHSARYRHSSPASICVQRKGNSISLYARVILLKNSSFVSIEYTVFVMYSWRPLHPHLEYGID